MTYGQSLASMEDFVILSHTAMVLRIAATAPQESRRWAAVLSCGQSAKYAGEPSKHPTSSTSVLADVDFAEPADLCTHSLGYWRCFHHLSSIST